MQLQYDPRKELRRRRRTYIGYGVTLFAIGLAVLVAARQVIFRPWTARSNVTVAPVANGFLVVGGRSEHNDFYRDLLRVSLNGNSSDTGTAGTLHHAGRLPRGLISAESVTLDGNVYILGGTNHDGTYGDIYRYDPVRKRATRIGMLPGPRAFGAAVVLDGTIYYLGGFDGSTYRSEIIAIDPATGRTQIVGRMIEPLDEFAAVVINSAIYVFGGETAERGVTDRIVRYSLATDGGSSGAESAAAGSTQFVAAIVGHLREARDRALATTLNGVVYLAGGWTEGVSNDLVELRDTNSGFVEKDLTDIRYDISQATPVAVGASIYLVGGREKRYQRQIQIIRYSPANGATANLELESYVWW